MISRQASTPSMSGISTSMTIKSGSTRCAVLHGLHPIGSQPDDLEVRLVLQGVLEAPPHHRVVVDHHEPGSRRFVHISLLGHITHGAPRR